MTEPRATPTYKTRPATPRTVQPSEIKSLAAKGPYQNTLGREIALGIGGVLFLFLGALILFTAAPAIFVGILGAAMMAVGGSFLAGALVVGALKDRR